MLFLIAEEIISDCLEFADVALVVDVSGSIEGNGKYPGRFNKYIKWFLKTFVKGLHVASGRVQVGMVTFGNSGHLEFGLTSDLDKVIGKIELYDYKGQSNTNTSGGIEVMRTQLLSSKDPNYRPNSAHIAVVVTDGASNLDKDKTITSAKNARNDKIILLGIGVTKEVNLDELTGIATPLIAFDKTSLEKGIKTGSIALSGTVAYVPEIEGLNYGVVDQLVTHFKKTVCTTSKLVITSFIRLFKTINIVS